MMGSSDLGEQALTTAAEVGMKTQLDEAEDLDVEVHTDTGKAMQGEVDSVDIKGEGLVMKKDLRTEELEMHTGHISVNPFKAALGSIELEHPTDATARVVLTEKDIERAFNSDFIRSKIHDVRVQVNGQPQTVNARQIQFRLPQSKQVELSAEVEVAETGETKQVAFTATPSIGDNGHRVVLENVQPVEGKAASPELTEALLDSASELLDLRNFEMQGMSLRLKQLDIQSGKLTLQATANVQKFPGA